MDTYDTLPCQCGHTLSDHQMATRWPCQAQDCDCQVWRRVEPADSADRIMSELAAMTPEGWCTEHDAICEPETDDCTPYSMSGDDAAECLSNLIQRAKRIKASR